MELMIHDHNSNASKGRLEQPRGDLACEDKAPGVVAQVRLDRKSLSRLE
jgi:hypothetical protein